MVIESVENLAPPIIVELLKIAKELADSELGRFVFVFSPSDKLAALSGEGSLTRATIMNVGDLSREATQAYLTSKGCPLDRATAVYELTRGHLPVLVDGLAVNSFCKGKLTKDELEAAFLEQVAESAVAVDFALTDVAVAAGRTTSSQLCAALQCSCAALQSVLHARAEDAILVQAKSFLLQHHLARASLEHKRLVVDSALVRRFIERKCTTSGGSIAPTIPGPPQK